MELLNITHKAYKYYRNRVKGNKDITYEQARKKLSRNVMLAKLIPPKDQEEKEKGCSLYCYGNLYILVKNEWVIQVKNYRGGNYYHDWEFDAFKHVDLSRELGIAE